MVQLRSRSLALTVTVATEKDHGAWRAGVRIGGASTHQETTPAPALPGAVLRQSESQESEAHGLQECHP